MLRFNTSRICQLCPTCLPCLLKEVERDLVSKIRHSPNPKPLPERGLHLAALSRLALDQGQERQAEHPQRKAIDGMDLQMGGNAAGAQQGVCQGVGAKAELDDDIETIETAVTHDLQAVTPYYQKAQRYLRRSQTQSRLKLKLTWHRLWWRSLRKMSTKATCERYLVHMAPSASLTYR